MNSEEFIVISTEFYMYIDQDYFVRGGGISSLSTLSIRKGGSRWVWDS